MELNLNKGYEFEDILKISDERNIKHIPICIPSYNRYNGKASSINILAETNLETYVFVYENEIEKYKERYKNSKNIKFVQCTCKKGLRYKRNNIIEYMSSLGHKEIFVLDDDVKKLCYSKWGKTKKGTDRINSYDINPEDYFKAWLTINDLMREDFKKENREMALSCCLLTPFAFGGNYKKELYSIASHCFGLVYIDLEKISKEKIRYEEETDTWEDLDFVLSVFEKNYYCPKIKILSNDFGSSGDDNSVSVNTDRSKELTLNIIKKWGKITKPRTTKDGTVFVKINIARIKSMIKNKKFKRETCDEHYKKCYNEIYN